jgi:hypothetical protein
VKIRFPLLPFARASGPYLLLEDFGLVWSSIGHPPNIVWKWRSEHGNQCLIIGYNVRGTVPSNHCLHFTPNQWPKIPLCSWFTQCAWASPINLAKGFVLSVPSRQTRSYSSGQVGQIPRFKVLPRNPQMGIVQLCQPQFFTTIVFIVSMAWWYIISLWIKLTRPLDLPSTQNP